MRSRLAPTIGSSLSRSLQPLGLSPFRPRAHSGFLYPKQKMSSKPPELGSSHPPMKTFGNFDFVKHVTLDFTDVSVSKWRSRVTGLNVVHLNYQAPIVKGYFVVPTEIFDDSGCPHTLEHLIFMGSEKYPFKGVLDNLANRAFAEGTNAWTDTDHTCYTIATAGQEGFLQLLPIYIDHVLYPTLTDHGFVTEVHHIDPKGRDSGVVYSEMEGKENTSGDLMALRMSRLFNAPGSAYRSETGGLMSALRSLTVEQIRSYHGTYYVPYNICLIIAGNVSTTSLLDVLQNQVENSIVNHCSTRPVGWKRPFVDTATAHRKPLQEILKTMVEFPENDETCGELSMTFVGSAPNDFLTAKALEVLGSYLTSSPVAPLNKEFIEISSPLCTDISINENTRVTYCDLELYVSSIPTEHLQIFDVRLRDALQRVSDEGLDMKRMKMVLKRDKRKFRSALESSRGDLFSEVVIADFLYGREDGEYLEPAMNDILLYETLTSWSEKQWLDLLQKYLVLPPYAVVYGKPSVQLADHLESCEKDRISKQVARLGQTGLSEAANKLEEAQAHNDRPIPSEYLTSFPLPDVGQISWIAVQTARNNNHQPLSTPSASSESDLSKHLAKDPTDIPFFIQYDHVQSDFVTVHAFMSLEGLPDHLRPYISTYLSSFFALPVNRPSSGSRLTHEEVINGLEDDIVHYEASLGLNGHFSELVRISLKVEVPQYEEAVAWLSDLIMRSEFEKERLEVTVAKIQQSLPEAKREGSTVVGSLSGSLLFTQSSTAQAGTVLNQVEFIPRLAERLKAVPNEVVLDLEELRRVVTKPSGLRFGVTGNILALHQPKAAWSTAFKAIPKSELRPVPLAYTTLSPLGLHPRKKVVIMPLPSIESTYAIHSTKTILGFDHPDFPAMRVTIEVLNATEGFLWRYIRGAGLAYDAYASLDVETGLLSFSTYRGSNHFQAFQEARKIIKELTDGSVTLDEPMLESCKSAIVYAVTKELSTPGRAAIMSFENQILRGVPQDHTTALLAKYQAVTIQDVINSLRTHFLPLFDSENSVAAVVAGPSKIYDVARGLESMGFEIEERQLSEDLHVDDSDDSEDESSDVSSTGSRRYA